MRAPVLIFALILSATAADAQDIAEAQRKMKESMAAATAKRQAESERLSVIQWETNEKDWETPPEKPIRMPNPCAKETDAEDREMGLLPSECAGKTRGTLVTKEIGFNWVGNGDKIWVAKLDGQFFLKPELMIASIYPDGGCAYKATLEHELLHWDDYRQIYKIVLERTKTLIVETEFPTKSNPHVLAAGETVDSYRAAFDRSVYEIIKEWRGRLKFAAGKATVKRDTDETEAKKREACGKEWNGRAI